MKRPETKKTEKWKKVTQQSCSSHLNERTEDVGEQNTKAQEKNKNYKMICIPWPPTQTLI